MFSRAEVQDRVVVWRFACGALGGGVGFGHFFPALFFLFDSLSLVGFCALLCMFLYLLRDILGDFVVVVDSLVRSWRISHVGVKCSDIRRLDFDWGFFLRILRDTACSSSSLSLRASENQ